MAFTRHGKIRKAIRENRVDRVPRPPLLKRKLSTAIKWHSALETDLQKTIKQIEEHKDALINGHKFKKPRIDSNQKEGIFVIIGGTALGSSLAGLGHFNALVVGFGVAGTGYLTMTMANSYKLRKQAAQLNRLLKTKRLKTQKKGRALTQAEIESNKLLISELEEQLKNLKETNQKQIGALMNASSNYLSQ
ncbi:MAG: hypothetical protein Q7S21_05245 [archaeon]|nr:hypothetical protein [archaeon]